MAAISSAPTMATERSKAQRAAEARYDQKRRSVTITLRLSREQAAWLDSRRKSDESRPSALRRLAKMPDMPPNDRNNRRA